MKKFLMATAAAALFAGPAMAAPASSTADLALHATVAEVCGFTLSNASGSVNTELNNNQPVVTIDATCNLSQGAELTATTLYGLAFSDGATTPTLLTYVPSFANGAGGSPATVTTTGVAAGGQFLSVSLVPSVVLDGGTVGTLSVDVGDVSAYAGTYDETVTFTLTPNP